MVLQIPPMAPTPIVLSGLLRLGLNGNNLCDEGVLTLLDIVPEATPHLRVLGLS